MDNVSSIKFFIPELFLTVAVIAVIIAGLINKNKNKFLIPGMSVAALLGTVILSFTQYEMGMNSLFFNMTVLDPMSVFFKILVAAATIWIVLFSLQQHMKVEYYILLLITNLGMFLMASANDLLMILVSLEVVGLSSYVLAGYYKNNMKSSEASLKYVLYGAASTGIMAYGMSILYGLTGETNLAAIQQQLLTQQPYNLTVFISIILIFAGFGYKIAMVPFHFWVPDVYEGAPTPITAFFSVAPKAAGLALLIRFMTTVVGHQLAPGAAEWLQNMDISAPLLIAILSVLTMTLGNTIALQQKNVKRMMAYSSIAHAGYLLMAFVVFNKEGYAAIMLYLVFYLLMNFGAFFIIHMVAQKLGSEDIETFYGLGYRAPFAAVSMAIFMFSLTGLPPLAGFIGKFYLFAAIINGHWYWLAVAGVLNSVISLYYYAGVARAMFLVKTETKDAVSFQTFDKILIATLVIPTLVFGIYWTPILELTMRSIKLFAGN